jgi:hypothetical protein
VIGLKTTGTAEEAATALETGKEDKSAHIRSNWFWEKLNHVPMVMSVELINTNGPLLAAISLNVLPLNKYLS